MIAAIRILLIVTVLAVVPVWVQAQVSGEGSVARGTPQALDASRTSSYSSAPGELPLSTPLTAAKKHAASAQASTQVFRSSTLAKSARAAYFSIYDAGRTLITDRDGDGQFSEFQIRFDADVSVGDALVYARLYLRRVGDTGGWRLYHTTNDFWIYGQSGSDDYFVTTTLDAGFPAGDYDVLIDLYETGYSGAVATIDAYDSSALGYLALEEVGLDVPFGLPGYSILGVATTLLIDDDNDGFASRFRVSFDPDTDFGSSHVYAEVWVRPQGGAWIQEHTTDDFRVDVSGAADSYSFTADWISGYPTANYDVQIDLYEAASGLLVASAGSERFELARLPLEDQVRDRYINPPTNGGANGSATSGEQGGGAVSHWFAAMLMALALGRLAVSRALRRRNAPAHSSR